MSWSWSIILRRQRRERRFHLVPWAAPLAFVAVLFLAACGTTDVGLPYDDPAEVVPSGPAGIVTHVLEAEVTFVGSAMTLGSDPLASRGGFVTHDNNVRVSSVIADAVIDIADAGEYSLWVRMLAPSASSNMVRLGFNGSTERVVATDSGRYVWLRAASQSLPVGRSSITLAPGSAGTRIDMFAVVRRSEGVTAALDQLVEPPEAEPEPGPSEPDPTEPEPTEPTEPEPTEPEPTEPEPGEPPSSRFSPSLRGDPSFDAALLSGEAAVWHSRVVETVTYPGPDLNPMALATRDDLYRYGRPLQMYVQSVLMTFRMTGDLKLLDHVDEIAERMRAELRDSWRGTMDGSDGTSDGYLNWVWRYSSGDSFVGKDTHRMDDAKTHAMIALIAVALDTNRDLLSPGGRDYGAHADFWRHYLVDHFEAKWRERMSKPSGFPIMDMWDMHSHMSWMRWHYYMGQLTGNVAYTNEAKRLADVWWAEMRPANTRAGTAYVWAQGVLSMGTNGDYLMPSVYASMVFADVVEMHLEGFDRWSSPTEIRRFARTFTEFMLDTSNPVKNGIALDIGGGVARRGLRSDANWPRMTTHGFWLGGFPLLAAWDDTGRIAAYTEAAHAQKGSNVGMMLESGALLADTMAYVGTASATLASIGTP